MRTMKRILLCMLGILTLVPAMGALPASAEGVDILTALQTATYHYEDDRGLVNLPYRYYFPSDYDADGGKTYPILIFLHGAGERGTDNTSHVSINDTLFQTLIGRDDCILLAPQCAANYRWVEHDWGLGSYTADEVASPMLSAAMALLKETIENEAVDASRVYAMGLSMGAFGVWDMLIREPDLFAAAIPSEGAGDPSKAELLVDIPIWTFHGDQDAAVPVTGTREMVAAIKEAGGKNIKYTEFAGRGHGCWYTVWESAETYRWLFSQVNASALPAEPDASQGAEASDGAGAADQPDTSEPASGAQDAEGSDSGSAGPLPLIAILSAAVIAVAGVIAAVIAVSNNKKKKKS